MNRRFINADMYASTGQGFLGTNMFAYCNNNPICFADETGYVPGIRTWNNLMTDGGTNSYYTTGETVVFNRKLKQEIEDSQYYFEYSCKATKLQHPVTSNDSVVTVDGDINYTKVGKNVSIVGSSHATIYDNYIPFVDNYASLIIQKDNIRLRIEVVFIGKKAEQRKDYFIGAGTIADEMYGVAGTMNNCGGLFTFGPGSLTPWLSQPK